MATAIQFAALVILDIQHRGKPGKEDLGASHDFDGDGLVEQGENEAELTPLYAESAKAALEAAGVDVVVLDSGSYASRWKRAAALAKKVDGPVAYVACHLNAGAEPGKGYGLVCYDHRSSGGARMAREVGAELTRAFSRDELSRVIADQRAATGQEGSGFPRAIHTIAGIYDGPGNLSGICFEPIFLDAHAELLGELTRSEAHEKSASEAAHARKVANDREAHKRSREKAPASVLETRRKTFRAPRRSPTRGEVRASARRSATLDRIGRSLAAGLITWLRLNRRAA